MDDIRRSNLLFLVGVVGLGMPGCDDTVAPRPAPSSPSGNPLEKDNSLAGADDDSGICEGYATRTVDCASGYGYGYGYGELADYVSRCELFLSAARRQGDRCGDALEELFACVAEQDCQSFACSGEESAVDLACGRGEGFGTTG